MAKINITISRTSVYVKELEVGEETLKQLRNLLHYSDDSFYSENSKKMLELLGMEESDLKQEKFSSDVEINDDWHPMVPTDKKVKTALCKDKFCPHGCHDGID